MNNIPPPPEIPQERIKQAWTEWVRGNTEDAHIAFEKQQLKAWLKDQRQQLYKWAKNQPHAVPMKWLSDTSASIGSTIEQRGEARSREISDLQHVYNQQRALRVREHHEPLFPYFASLYSRGRPVPKHDFRADRLPNLAPVDIPRYFTIPPALGKHRPATNAHFLDALYTRSPRKPDVRYFYNARVLDAHQQVPYAYHEALLPTFGSRNPMTGAPWTIADVRWLTH
jgi:hypothetical protein